MELRNPSFSPRALSEQRVWSSQLAAGLARRPQIEKLRRTPELCAAVGKRLMQRWSPEQVANHLRVDFPADPAMWISHETLYRSVYLPRKPGLDRFSPRT